MTHIEQEYVQNFYNKYTYSFDATRYAPWPCVKQYIDTIPSYSKICDVGCGNGKNQYRTDLIWSSCDNSIEMCKLMKQKYNKSISLSDCTQLPYQCKSFDSFISIAVLHHLSSEKRRMSAIKELYRILKPGGTGLISVWGSQPRYGTGDKIIDWNNDSNQRYIHFFTYDEIYKLVSDVFSFVHIGEDHNNLFIYVKKELS